MAIATVPVYDAIRVSVSSLPHGQAAGYSTGSGVVPWGAAEWAAHPGAVRICQDPSASDTTADILDVETGAATVADVPGWCEAAAVSFAAARRPGQRHPAIYVNLSSLTSSVNALVSAGIVSGVGLWIANWNLTEAEARALVQLAAGPYPVIGCQYGNRGAYDVSVFSSAWLAAVSGDLPPVYPDLQQGMTGAAVVTLQDKLNVRGAHLAADGVFGPATKAAVQAFQAASHLTADGICGPLTWAKLG